MCIKQKQLSSGSNLQGLKFVHSINRNTMCRLVKLHQNIQNRISIFMGYHYTNKSEQYSRS